MARWAWIAVFVAAGILGAYNLIGVYNLVGLQQEIRGKTAEIWNQVERAGDLLPRLEQQLNASIQLERDLIEEIARARSAFDTASQGNTSDPATVDNAAQALLTLRAFMENYPDIGLSQLQQDLFIETTGSINRITFARGELIRVTTDYNTTKARTWPAGEYFPRYYIPGEFENPERTTLPPSRVGVSPAPEF